MLINTHFQIITSALGQMEKEIQISILNITMWNNVSSSIINLAESVIFRNDFLNGIYSCNMLDQLSK